MIGQFLDCLHCATDVPWPDNVCSECATTHGVPQVSDKVGMKNDSDKIRMELLAPEAIEGTAQVLTFGAKKYSDRNWEAGISYCRVFGGIMRHLWAWFRGEDLDPETGFSHLHHASCGIMFLQTYHARNMVEFDDRPIIKKAA